MAVDNPLPRATVSETIESGSRRVRSVMAIADQCLFSGVNFLTSVLIGRFAGSESLGRYALAMSIVTLLVGLQRAILMSPYVILRGEQTADQRRRTRGSLLMFCVTVGVVGGGVAGLVALITRVAPDAGWGSPVVGMMALPMMLAIPAGLLRDFSRRLSIVRFDVAAALAMDFAVTVLQLVALGGLVAYDRLSAPAALAVAALVWIVVSAVALLCSRRTFGRPAPREHWRQLWPIGRWVSLTSLVATLQTLSMPWIMAAMVDIRLAGIYAACWTLVQVVAPLIEGIGNLIGPRLAGSAQTRRWSELISVFRTNTLLFVAIMSTMMVTYAVVGRAALGFVYGDDYIRYFGVLMGLAAAATANNVGIPGLKALIQIGYERFNCFVSLIGYLIAVVAAVLLLPLDPAGGAYGLLIGGAVATMVRWTTLSRIDPVFRDDVSALSTAAANR